MFVRRFYPIQWLLAISNCDIGRKTWRLLQAYKSNLVFDAFFIAKSCPGLQVCIDIFRAERVILAGSHGETFGKSSKPAFCTGAKAEQRIWKSPAREH